MSQKEILPDVKGMGWVRNEYIVKEVDAWKIELSLEEIQELYPALKSEIDMPSASILEKNTQELSIVFKNDGYVWKSNNNLPLEMYEKEIKVSARASGARKSNHEYSPKIYPERSSFYVFCNPNQQGFIVIEKIPPVHIEWHGTHGCYRGGLNYVEYRLSEEGSLYPVWGSTDPFPYPVGDTHNCGALSISGSNTSKKEEVYLDEAEVVQ
ncbi:MAG: hypothetical protein R3F41_17580 [Gammaproteobacteria bacterium]|nr:hypothetical protein [Pseudomonadales bacterium]